MAVPTLISDLSTTAASNSPTGGEVPTDGDNYLRAHAAFIAQLDANKAPKASPTFTGTVTADVLTTTGNTTLGNASTDTLNVGNNGLVKDGSGNVGIGTGSPIQKFDISTTGENVTACVRTGSGYSTFLELAGNGTGVGSASFSLSQAADSVASVLNRANAALYLGTNGTERMRIDASGNVISNVSGSAPALGTNSQMVFSLTSNTNLRISVRGTDGVTRTANITLA
jgi:hypothetical protein